MFYTLTFHVLFQYLNSYCQNSMMRKTWLLFFFCTILLCIGRFNKEVNVLIIYKPYHCLCCSVVVCVLQFMLITPAFGIWFCFNLFDTFLRRFSVLKRPELTCVLEQFNVEYLWHQRITKQWSNSIHRLVEYDILT